MIITEIAMAQDYFAIVKKADDTTFRYPSKVNMTLTGSVGDVKLITAGEAIDVTGDYTLEIEVLWREKPEIIKSEGKRLEYSFFLKK